MNNYPADKTALVVVDPFNDFLSEGEKLYPFTKETVEGAGVVQHLKALIAAAREKHIQVVYAPHHHSRKGDYEDWKFLSPSYAGSNLLLS